MFCQECAIEKDDKDFYKENICYKCQYYSKTKNKTKQRKCVICDQLLDQFRFKYCGTECAKKGRAITRDQYWIKTLTDNSGNSLQPNLRRKKNTY